MKIIQLDEQNIETEHICCAISGKENQQGVSNKKAWLKKRMREGLIFKKMDVRGKVFVEYIPAEFAWRPIHAPNYMFIHCLWVSGSHQKKGYARRLLQTCLEDSKNKAGVCVVTSKKTFLTDKKFFEKFGFEQCDEAPPHFELMVKKFNSKATNPSFTPSAKKLKVRSKADLYFHYSDQCPFTHHYVNVMAEVGKTKKLSIETKKITTCKQAQKLPSAFGTFGVYLNGKFLTHQIFGAKGFDKFLEKNLK